MAPEKNHPPPQLEDADLSLKLGRKENEERLEELQLILLQIRQGYLFQEHSTTIVFEG